MIGSFFIFSGFEKLIRPYENFLYVVSSYEFLSQGLAELVAKFLPWVEFILGVFLVLGLWLKIALRVLGILLLVFLVAVGQAILRNLPLKDCGCFGELFSLPLLAVFLLDSCLLVLTSMLIAFLQSTSLLSLDRHFLKNK